MTGLENYDETARRELKEELGVDVPLERMFKLTASSRTDNEFIWSYRGVVSGDPIPNKCEIERGVFFAPAFVECWKAYRGKMNSKREEPIRPETFFVANGAESTA